MIGLALVASTSARAQPTLIATVENTRPLVGETIVYQLKLTSSQPLGDILRTLHLPSVTGLTSLGAKNKGSMTSIVNGRATYSQTVEMSLRVEKEGEFKLPGATATYLGQSYRGNEVTIIVDKAAQGGVSAALVAEGVLRPVASGNPSLSRQLNGRVFCRPVVSNRKPFVREQVVVSYYTYIAADFASYVGKFGYEPIEPSHKSVLIQSIHEAHKKGLSLESVQVDGQRFNRYLLSQQLVFCTRPGEVALPDFDATIYVRTQGSRTTRRNILDPSFDPFADIFNDPFSRSRELPVVLPTRGVRFDVRALPTTGRPDDFGGAVGDYTISATLSQDTVKEFDLVNLQVKLEGLGQIDGVPAPTLEEIPSVEVFADEGETKASTTAKGYGGSKTFDIVLKPTAPGERVIPSICYNFFNPKTETYETIETEPLTLTVERDPDRDDKLLVVSMAPGVAASASASESRVRVISTGIRPIEPRAPLRVYRRDAFYLNPLFWLAQLAPVVLFAIATVVGARRRRLDTDEDFARSSRARDRASRRLRGAAKALRAHDSEAFHLEVGAALRGLVADRCALATAGATNVELRDAVCARVGDEALGDRLRDLLASCDAARYAPGDAAEQCERNWDEARALTRELERALR